MTNMRSSEAIIKTFEDINCPRTIIHLNDSLGDFGSRKDRHAFIGQGLIWSAQDGETQEEALESFNTLRDYVFDKEWDIILETPSPDLYEIDMLKVD